MSTENIKMRICKKGEEGLKCKTCGCNENQCIDMFEICFIGAESKKKAKIKLCDDCVETLFDKTLKASTHINSKLKSNHDLAIIRQRNAKEFIKTYGKQKHIPINAPEDEE